MKQLLMIMQFNLSLFSKYRAELMGVATLFIILCHMPAHGVVMPTFVSSIIIYGGLGCDIFLFLSGMGMWYSLKNIEKVELGGTLFWLKRRFTRVLLPYLLFAVPCFAIYAIRDHWTMGTYLWRLSTLAYWTDGWGLWFVSLILVLYLFTPFMHKMMCGEKKWVYATVLVILTWGISIFDGFEGIAGNVQFALCRMPSYIIGFILASYVQKGISIRLWKVGVYLLSLFIISLSLRFLGLHISLAWVEGIALIVFLAILTNALKNCLWIMQCLRFLGNISLESYCTNVFALSFFSFFSWQIGGINLNPGNWTYYIIGTLCCLVLSLFIHSISNKIIQVLSR